MYHLRLLDRWCMSLEGAISQECGEACKQRLSSSLELPFYAAESIFQQICNLFWWHVWCYFDFPQWWKDHRRCQPRRVFSPWSFTTGWDEGEVFQPQTVRPMQRVCPRHNIPNAWRKSSLDICSVCLGEMENVQHRKQTPGFPMDGWRFNALGSPFDWNKRLPKGRSTRLGSLLRKNDTGSTFSWWQSISGVTALRHRFVKLSFGYGVSIKHLAHKELIAPFKRPDKLKFLFWCQSSNRPILLSAKWQMNRCTHCKHCSLMLPEQLIKNGSNHWLRCFFITRTHLGTFCIVELGNLSVYTCWRVFVLHSMPLAWVQNSKNPKSFMRKLIDFNSENTQLSWDKVGLFAKPPW